MQQKWISQNLGPTIKNSQYSHLKIMALDDQLFFLPWFIELVRKNLPENEQNALKTNFSYFKMKLQKITWMVLQFTGIGTNCYQPLY